MPFSVHDNVDHPLSFYAATKKANELMAHTYASLYGLPVTGLRFFTVYGPWGRPDMALFLFTRNILAGKPIDVFNYGHHQRDFTYIDDIVDGVVRVAATAWRTPNAKWNSDDPDPATSRAPYRLYNIGNNRPVELMHYIDVLEQCLGKQAPRRTCCRCRPATCRTPGPTSRTSCATSATARRRRSRRASSASSTGTSSTTRTAARRIRRSPTSANLLVLFIYQSR